MEQEEKKRQTPITFPEQKNAVQENGAFSPEQIVSCLDSCVECDACSENCSIYQVAKSFKPLTKIKILREIVQGHPITKTDQQALFTCTKCEGCQTSCPIHLPLIALYDWGRHEIVRKYGFINPVQRNVIENILQFGNPFREGGLRYKNLSQLHDAKIHQHLNRRSKTLLFLGCMLHYRIPQMATDLFGTLEALKIEFTLAENESCCGYYVWNCGDHEGTDAIIKKNMEYMQEYDEIICACAGCFTFFRSNYPKTTRFSHVIEKIAESLPALLEEHPDAAERLKNANQKKEHLLFHDSCHLTRPWGIIDPPRDVLSLLGHQLTEFDRNRERNLCCGADGGMRFINKELAIKVGQSRLEEAAMKAKSLSTLCPFCIFNFREGNTFGDMVEIESLYHIIQNDIAHLLEG